MNLQLINVLLLGLAFHLIFFAFQTSVFIQQTVVNSIKTNPSYNFQGDGYISLCITYSVFALSNWISPSIIALFGCKYGMFLGALTYVLYTASFIYPTTILFYTAAALIGFGAGPLWTAQGSYLAKNSDIETSSRNAAIFWSMLQSSILFGNIFVFFCFNSEQKTIISDETRYIVYGVLTTVCILGTIVILTFRDNTQTLMITEMESITAWGQFLGALKLSKTLNIILLSFAFLFTGQLLSFYTGIYGTAIGATMQFGLHAKKYIGLSGVFIGIGEILGGVIFGLMGTKVNKGIGRDTVFVLGYIISMVAFSLIYINLPPDSSLVEFAIIKPIIEPKIWLAMLSSILIGFGDACFNTQIYSLLMSYYCGNSVAAFALFKFVQSLGSAVAFLYSTTLNLYYQLYILAVIGTIATLCFCYVEWTSSLKIRLKSDSQQDIVRKGSDFSTQPEPLEEEKAVEQLKKSYSSCNISIGNGKRYGATTPIRTKPKSNPTTTTTTRDGDVGISIKGESDI